MKRYFRRFPAFFITMAVAFMFYGCSRDRVEGPFDILYTGNLLGTIVPCNCPGSRAGGLIRRASAIYTLESDPQKQIILDAGNFAAIRPDIGKQKTELLLTGMMKLGLDAVSPGFRDLNNGIEYLLEIERKHHIPFISANLIVKETGEHPFPGHRIISIGANPFRSGMQVAVIGMVNGSPYRKQHKRSGVKFDDPVKALQRELNDIPQKVELTILMTDAPRETVEEWITKLGETSIGLILCSNNRTFNRDQGDINGIPFYPGNRLGKYLDRLIMDRSDSGGWEYTQQRVFLGKKVPADETMLTYLKKLQAEIGLTDNQVGYFDDKKTSRTQRTSESSSQSQE